MSLNEVLIFNQCIANPQYITSKFNDLTIPALSDGTMVDLNGMSDEERRKTLHRLFTNVWAGVMKYTKAILVQHGK
jgi:hypothetical protein